MEASSRKHRSRRRVAAFNFLTNISLDGTHRDTKYCIFQQKGIVKSGTSLATACNNGGKFLGVRSADALLDSAAGVTSNSRGELSDSEALNGGSRGSSVDPLESLGSHIFAQQASAVAEEENTPSKRTRVVLLSTSKVPFAIYSSLPYQKKKENLQPQRKDSLVGEKRRNERQTSGNQACWEGFLGLGVFEREEGQDVSYSQLLVPSRHRGVKKMTSQEGLLQPVTESAHSSPESEGAVSIGYNASVLDDPELRSGKHRTLLTFPSYVTSIVDYVKPSDLKKEVNEQFRERFPNMQLSLTKLRSLKRDMHKIGHIKCTVDMWTIAQSYVYFEKIILKGLINKPNRKLVCGACLLLSAKLNDVKGADLTQLVEEVEDGFKLHRRDLLIFEVAVLVALEFSLHIPDSEVYSHYQRLLHMS